MVPSIVNSNIPSQSEAGIDGNHGDTNFDSWGPTESWKLAEGSGVSSEGYLGGGNKGGGGAGKKYG